MRNIIPFEQFVFESREAKKVTFFIDMDGVLADFEREVDESPSGEAHKEAFDRVKAWMKEHYPKVEWRQLHDVKALSRKEPELAKLYKETSDYVQYEAKKEGFFKRLKPLPGAKEILETAAKLTGELPRILTACVKSSYCEPEKAEWLKDHFKGMYKEVIYEQDKEKYATNKYDCLIDDRQKNIAEFQRAGGSVIHHYPEDFKRTIEEMKRIASK